jgi:putative ABC transport system permease protein
MLAELISEIRYRLRTVFRRGAVEQELDAELQFHLEREAEKHVARGMPRDEALRRARLDFGGVERIKDDTRDAHGTRLLDSVLQDLRYAWRGVRSKPGFSIAVILTLALGLGANTAMFGILDRLLYRPPPFLRNGAEVHRVYLTATRDGNRLTVRNHSYARFNDLSAGTRSFTRTAAFANRPVPLGTGEDTREMIVGAVSASFFALFDAPPVLGRYFLPEEDAPPSGSPVLVLSYGFWQSRYGGRADVLGQTLQTGNRLATIIGVAPEGFIGVSEDGGGPVAWMPITAYAHALRGPGYVGGYGWTWLEMLAERKPEVSVAAASADLTQAFVRSYEAQRLAQPQVARPPASEARPTALAGPVQYARGPLAHNETKVATWLYGVAVIVLLVACANVANLLLARAVQRRREIALRLALGVTRGRLVRQFLTESLVLFGLGGIAALVVATLGVRVMGALFLPGSETVPVLGDGRSLAILGYSIVNFGLLTGIAPALTAGRGDAVSALKSGGREGSPRMSRVRAGLLISQMVFCVVLLVGAALFVGSLRAVRALRLGYDIDPVLYVDANTRSARLSDPEQEALVRRLLEVAQATPGVTGGTSAVSIPFWSNREDDLAVPGVDSVARLGRFLLQAGSPNYFAVMGTRILRGRGINAADGPQSPRVVVVSEGMERVLWRGRDAIGQQIRIGGSDAPYSTVVGVAEDVRGRLMAGEPEYWYYLPDAQYDSRADLNLLVRVNGTARDFGEALRRRLQAAMPGDGYVIVRPMEDLVGPNRRSWELGATMFVVFGGLALVLATVGLYSVIAYGVAQRSHELGVRVALGASGGRMLWLVVGQGIAFAGVGIVIGSVIALLAGLRVRPLLFNQSPSDPVVFVAVAAVLLVVAVVASAGPARRAVRADPTVALRSE